MKNIKRSLVIILGCIAFFLFMSLGINHFFLGKMFHPVSFLYDIVILFFSIFSGWTLINIDAHKKKILAKGIVLFIILSIFFLVLLSHVYHDSQDIDLSSIEKIKSLPYVSWSPVKKSTLPVGISKYDSKRSFKGLNLYCSRNPSKAYLMDMAGKIIHTWSSSFSDKYVNIKNKNFWHDIEMCKNGDLLVIIKDIALIRMDWQSKVKWIKLGRFHHDINIANNGDIYTLMRDSSKVAYLGKKVFILDDYIAIFSPEGKLKKTISISKLFGEKIPFRRLNMIAKEMDTMKKQRRNKKKPFLRNDTIFDVFHTNTISIIDRDIVGFCKKGDLLICIRELNLVSIIDGKGKEILWSWGPSELQRPHYPTLLENGNILIFDNGTLRKYSRILEIEPFTKKIVWKYLSDPPENFFSYQMGACQRLPNGNTLITDSMKGLVFEVEPEGDIVWEFYNPQIKMNQQDKWIATIYKMTRITDPKNYISLNKFQ